MKNAIFTAIVIALSFTAAFAQKGGKKGNKGKNLINLQQVNSQQATQDSINAAQALDSLNAVIAQRNQQALLQQKLLASQKLSGMFTTADSLNTFLTNLSKDTTKRAREFTEAFTLMHPKKKVADLSKGKVYPLSFSLGGWEDVRDSSGNFRVREIPGNQTADAYVVLTKNDFYFFNKRGAPLKEGEVLEAISSIKDRKVLSQIQGTLSAIRSDLSDKADQYDLNAANEKINAFTDSLTSAESRFEKLQKDITYQGDLQSFYLGSTMDDATWNDFKMYRKYINSGNDSLVKIAEKIAAKHNLNIKADKAESYIFYGKIAAGGLLLIMIIGFFVLRSGARRAGP